MHWEFVSNPSSWLAKMARPILGGVEDGNDAQDLRLDSVKDQILSIPDHWPKPDVSVPPLWILDGPAHLGILCEADDLRYNFFPHARCGLRIINGNDCLDAVQFGFRTPGKNGGELFQRFRLVKSCSAGIGGCASARSSSKIRSRSARAALSK